MPATYPHLDQRKILTQSVLNGNTAQWDGLLPCVACGVAEAGVSKVLVHVFETYSHPLHPLALLLVISSPRGFSE